MAGFGGLSDKPGDPDAFGDNMGDLEDWPDTIDTSPEIIESFYVQQGQVGDCWFLAALGGVARENPEFLSEQMVQNEDGTWTVTFYDDGEPVEITVNPTSYENAVGDYGGNVNWATIYEKAAAEFFGGDYGDIDGDFPDRALEAITGNDASSIGDVGLSEIQDALANGPVAVASEAAPGSFQSWFMGGVDDNAIVPGHAYIVNDVAMHVNPATGEEELMIQLVNPWGPGLTGEDGHSKWGEQWLTEDEYNDNFRDVYAGTVG